MVKVKKNVPKKEPNSVVTTKKDTELKNEHQATRAEAVIDSPNHNPKRKGWKARIDFSVEVGRRKARNNNLNPPNPPTNRNLSDQQQQRLREKQRIDSIYCNEQGIKKQ